MLPFELEIIAYHSKVSGFFSLRKMLSAKTHSVDQQRVKTSIMLQKICMSNKYSSFGKNILRVCRKYRIFFFFFFFFLHFLMRNVS